jgi:hypothetical protein
MSHARPTVSLAIGSLANTVSLSAGLGPLIATGSRVMLLSPRCRPTVVAAITLTPVTTAAHKEQSTTAQAAAKTAGTMEIRMPSARFRSAPHYHSSDRR